MLNSEELYIIQMSIPVLADRGKEIVGNFYQLLLSRYPELKHIFNHSHQKTGFQKEALTNAIYHLAKNLPNLDVESEMFLQIAHKHASLHIQPQHYNMVGECLLASLKMTLTEVVADEFFINTWAKTYQLLADAFINLEAKLMKDQQNHGFQKVQILDKIQETPEVFSFYFKPTIKQNFIPGQYLTLKIHTNGFDHLRQYSISQWNKNEIYRIGVKLEPEGVVSGFLHDHIEKADEIFVSAPFGNFKYHEQDTIPCFLAQGIGITSILPILQFLDHQHKASVLMHAARNQNFQPYLTDIQSLETVKKYFVYNEPEVGNPEKLNPEYLIENLKDLKKYSFYICGNLNFTQAMLDILHHYQVPSSQVHHEAFGPTQALKNHFLE